MACICTVLPRYSPPELHVLTRAEYQIFYEGYCKRLRAFLETYGRLSLGFCANLYAHDRGSLFPQEWEKDIDELVRKPEVFQMILELEQGMLKHLVEFPAISAFVKDAYSLSFPRTSPLSGKQLEAIGTALRRTELPWVPLLLAESRLNKALEVLLTALVSDVIMGGSKLAESILISLDKTGVDPYVREYFHQKIATLERVRDAIHPGTQLDDESLIDLDLGAGKGYYSLFQRFGLDRPVIAVEASVKQFLGLVSRSRTLIRRGILPEDALNRLLVAPLCLDASVSGTRIEAAAIPALEVETKGEEHVSGSNIQGSCFPRTTHFVTMSTTAKTVPNSYCLIGLHACGGLSRLALQLLQQADIATAITFPCCYGHIHTPEHFPCTEGGREICLLFDRPEYRELEPPHYPGGPPRLLLNYAGSGFNCPPAQTLKDLDSFMSRATVEYMRVRLLRDSTKRMLPRQGDRSLMEWMKSIAAGANDLGEQDILACIQHCHSRRWQMGAHYLVRKLVGQVFETFILLDRLAWLNSTTIEEEESVIHSGCFSVMTELSARGFCLLGMRTTVP